MAGAAALLAGCDEIDLPEAAHDRGGTSFDIAKLSAEKFPAGAYPNVGPSCLVKDWTGVHTNGDEQVVALPHGRGGKFRIVARTKVRPLDPEVPMRDTAIMIRIGSKNPWFRETPKRGSYVWNGFMKRSRDWFVATKVFDVRPGETHALVMLKCERARIELKDVVLCEEVAQPPAPDAPADTDPLVIETQFCSTVGPTFEVSEGQVGEIGFAFRRPKDEKCNFWKGKFRLELPAGIDYVDATFAAAGTAKTVRRPDGSSVTEFSPGDCPIGLSAPWWNARYVLLAATRGVGDCGDGRLVYAYDDGKRAFECASMKIRFSVGPAIRVAQPKRYGMGGWQLNAYEFKDPKSVERLARFHRDCGQTWIIPSAKTSYPELPTWRACGFRTVTPQSGVWCRNGYELAAEKVPETDRFVPVGDDHGRYEHSYRIAVCPLAVKERTPYVRDVVLKRIADNVRGVDGMWSNWEPFMFNGGGCACARCGKAFAAFLGKDWTEVAKTWPGCAFQKGAYEKEGREFRSRCHADVVRTIDACVRGVTGKDSVGFLPGIHFGQMTSSWRTHHPMPEASPEHYAADIPWLNLWGPYVAWRSQHPYLTERARHVAHCACARDLRDQIAADYPPERRPRVLTAPQGTCGDYFTEPEAFEMNFDAYFFNGFAGCCPWVFPVGADARWWRAFANAAARAAKYEDAVADGAAADKDVALETVPEYAKPVAQLMRYLHNWKKVPQVFTTSYDFRGLRIVAVFNCWRRGEAFFTLKQTGLAEGEYAVVSEDGVLWADSRAKATWTAEELAKGVFLSVGCCRTRVFEIVPAGDRPLTEPKSVMTAERLRAAYAERKADLARLAAEDAALAEDDLAGISWCD